MARIRVHICSCFFDGVWLCSLEYRGIALSLAQESAELLASSSSGELSGGLVVLESQQALSTAQTPATLAAGMAASARAVSIAACSSTVIDFLTLRSPKAVDNAEQSRAVDVPGCLPAAGRTAARCCLLECAIVLLLVEGQRTRGEWIRGSGFNAGSRCCVRQHKEGAAVAKGHLPQRGPPLVHPR